MKKILVLATAALLVSSVTFANGDDDKKKCAKGKDCCKKEGKSCKKDMKEKAKDAKTAEVKPAAKKA